MQHVKFKTSQVMPVMLQVVILTNRNGLNRIANTLLPVNHLRNCEITEIFYMKSLIVKGAEREPVTRRREGGGGLAEV